LAVLATLGIPRDALAIPPYPGDLQTALKLSSAPACSLCHEGGVTGIGTVTTPFGRSMRANGLTFDESTFAPALAAMESKAVDSVGRGFSDVTALKEGVDPNAVPASAVPTTPPPPDYGCTARVSPHRVEADEAWFAVALCACAISRVRGRRRRA
jgi:hypothetical protein